MKLHGTNHSEELIRLKYDCQTLTQCSELSNQEGDGMAPSFLVSASRPRLSVRAGHFAVQSPMPKG